MKKIIENKKIFVSTLCVLVFISFGIYYLFLRNDDDSFIVGKTLNISNASDYLVQYENGDYYLMKANANIRFQVSTKEKEVQYKIVDENKKEVSTKVTKGKKNFEIVPSKNYEAGKTYQITLENAFFTDDKLKDIRTLYFTIVRPNANTQVLNKDVIQVNQDVITHIEKDDTHYTIVSNKEFKKGDILYYRSKDTTIAFKVDDITKENNLYIIKTVFPTLEEVFQELDIYGEFHSKLDNFIAEDDLKEYIKIAIEKDGLLDSIIPKAYALQNFNIEITHQRDNSYKVKIGVILEHGKQSKLKALEKHDLKFNIEFITKLKVHSEINFFRQDIGASLEIDMGTEFKIESHDDNFLALKKEVEEGEEWGASFSGLHLDESEETKPLTQTTIFLPITGLTLNCKVGILKEFKIAMEAAFRADSKMSIRFGYNNQGFYREFDLKSKENSYSILGKGESRLGVETNFNINFIGVLEVGVDLPVGVYGEGEISAAGSKEKKEYQGNFEFGAFVGADLYAQFKILKLSIEEAHVTYEKKMPLIELKGSATTGNQENCEEKLLSGDFSCYAGTYTYMVGGSSQKTKFVLDQDGKITGDGFSKEYNQKPISIEKQEDGTYRIEHQFYFETPSGEKMLTSKYFYLAPTNTNLTYYSFQGTMEETDRAKIRIKEEGFISADSNVVYQREEVSHETCEEKIMKKDFSCYTGSYTNKYNASDIITLKADGSIERNGMKYRDIPLSCVDETSGDYANYRCITEYKDTNFDMTNDIGFRLFPIGFDSGWGDINKIRLAVLKGNGADIYEKNE